MVLTQGCIASDPDTCDYLRGYRFHVNESRTWQDQGLFQLPLRSERYLNYSGNADYGFDNITLGWPGSGGPALDHQVVTGLATKDFYIGSLGLSPYPVNFTNFSSPFPSMLTTLKNDNVIASLAYGYTAGAPYLPIPRYGSLTFGGYDSTRSSPENITVVMGPDTNRDLVLGISAITSGQESLLPESVVAYIDSTVAQIWLPIVACERFESVFGLVWNEDLNLYLVNNTLHEKLVAMDPKITFSLNPGLYNATKAINISFSYASFDLTASYPLVGNTTSRYFPLRRAQNSSQYTLGRTFLQEAYLTVDYDRSTFSVSQALFPDPGIDANLVPIYAPNATDVSTAIPPYRLSTPIIGGIAGAVVSTLFILGLVSYFLHKYLIERRKHTGFRGYEADGEEYRELDGDARYIRTPELGVGGSNEPPAKMSGGGPPLEMPAHRIYEMSGGWVGAELGVPQKNG